LRLSTAFDMLHLHEGADVLASCRQRAVSCEL
jgi:hypothetical protein